MGIRCLVAACFCWSAIALGQTSGNFYLEKKSYALGEPIFVYFQVVNNGPKPEIFRFGDPYSIQPSCSPYRITVSRDWPVEPRSNLSCPARGISVGCGGSKVVLQPGETHVDRVLLNLSQKVDAAGGYSVQAAYGVPFRDCPRVPQKSTRSWISWWRRNLPIRKCSNLGSINSGQRIG